MSSTQATPNYGKVREICERLGYQSKIKNDRHFDVLRQRTVAYRMKFIDSSLGQGIFPLQYDAKEAQSCATSFLAKYPELFSAQRSISSTPHPIPQDKDFIRDELAKLFCTQHFKWLQNTEYANAKRLRDADQERESSQIDDDDDDSGVDDMSKVRGSSNGRGHAIWVQSDPDELPSDESDKSDCYDSDQERLRIEKNIAIHLGYAYPLDNSRDGKKSEWIFSSEKWPTDVEPFAFRYLHERNLYNTRTENMEALNKFSKDFIDHMGLECTEVQEKIVFKKCEGLIKRVGRKWHHDYGFLTKTDKILRKTPVFQKAWNAQRLKWLATKDNGRSGHLIEIPRRETPVQAPSAKRPIDLMTPETGHSMREQPPHKRMTIGVPNQSFQEGTLATPITGIGGDSFQSSTASHTTITSKTVVEEFQAANAGEKVVSSELEKQRPSFKVSDNAHTSESPVPTKLSSSNARPAKNQLDIGPPSPSNVNQQDVPAVRQNPRKAVKGALHFSIENEKGIPDSRKENLVSGNTFWGTTLDEFFNLVSRRSGKPLDTLTSLTFRYDWGSQHAELFLKNSGKDAWTSFKTDLINYFRLSRAERPEREAFIVWVRCGDTITVGDGDEYDL